MTDFDLTAFYGQFRDETRESLDILEQGLTELEARPGDVSLLDGMLRAIHTTKGSAKIMGFAEINRLAHAIEDVLGAVRKAELELTAEVGTVLLEASAGLRTLADAHVSDQQHDVDVVGLLAALRKIQGRAKGPAEAPPPAESTAPAETPPATPVLTMAAQPKAQIRETMRVDLNRLDQLAVLVGEVLSLQNQSQASQIPLSELGLVQEQNQRALEDLKSSLEKNRVRLRSAQAAEILQILDRLESGLGKQAELWREFSRDYSALQERFSLAVGELHRETQGIRMQPISTIFERFPGVVRRIAAECGVEVTMGIEGGEVELDRRVLDLLRDPFIHLVRNAIDHGIEPPQERLKLGKPRQGNIVLAASQQGRRVLVQIKDDGRGIDLESIRRTVIERGLLDEKKAQEASPEALLEFIFQPGFSTRSEATDMSGRGVGLNVVQTAIRQLNGLVHIDTQPGQGSIFTLDVPLTLATNRVLFVESAGATWALPTAGIRSLVRVQPKDLVPVEGKPTLNWHNQTLPLYTLSDVLELPSERPIRQVNPAVITGSNGRQFALLVERVLDEAEVVVRPLGRILEQSEFFSTATLSGSDQVIPILDLTNLLTRRASTAAKKQWVPGPTVPADGWTPTILLVEDTITTRELERSILEAAGYRVVTAFDGIDALDKMEQNRFYLVITDIEMPRMDGFELTARIRQDPRWEDMPVMIITAHEDEARRRRGLQVGAQAYIVKSRFDQSNLLEVVARWIGQP